MNLNLILALTRDLDEHSRTAIVDLCTTAHHEDFSPLFTFLPPDGLHALAYRDPELVGHAVRTTRWIQPAGFPALKTAYIDAVATAEYAQGQGIGSRVMTHLAETIYREDYALAALETDKPGFYTRLGWEVWPGPLGVRKENGVLATPEFEGRVLILRTSRTPELDLASLLTIEDQGRSW